MPVITLTTAGNNSVVIPAGVTSLDSVIAQGGGGGGGGASAGSGSTGGGGGGGECSIELNVAVTPGTYIAVVGAAGTASGGANGVAGGNSSFPGDAVTVIGHGGSFGSTSSGGGAAGAGGTGSTNAAHFNGGSGASGVSSTRGGGGGGSAGSTGAGGTSTNASGGTAGTGSPAGAAGGAGSTSSAGSPGNAPGAGGGGAKGGAIRSGGAGAAGQIIISYTIPSATGVSTMGGQGTLAVQATQQGSATLAASSSMNAPQVIQQSPLALTGQASLTSTGNAFTGNFFQANSTLTAKATQGVKPSIGGAGVLTAQAVQGATATLSASSSMSASHTQTNIGAVGSLTAVGSVTGRISSSTSSTWATCNSVRSASLLCTWETQMRKTVTEQVQWRNAQRRFSVHPFAFDVPLRVVSTSPVSEYKDYGRVSKSPASSAWNTLKRPLSTVRCSWQTEQRRTDTANSNWNVLTNFSLLASHAVFRWDDYQRLTENATVLFSTQSGNPRVSKTGQSFTWNTPERMPASKTFTWNTRGSVRIVSAASCNWRTRQAVSKTGRPAAWNVRLRSTTTGRPVAWDDNQRRAKSQGSAWNVISRRPALTSKLSGWDTMTRTTTSNKIVLFSSTKRFSKTTSPVCTWNTQQKIVKPATLKWNDYVRKSETRTLGTHVFSLFSDAVIVIPGIQWETRRQLASTALTCKYNVRNRRGATSPSIQWDILPHVSKTPVSIAWNSRQRPHKIQTIEFGNVQRVFKPAVQSDWLVLGTSSKTATIKWNVGAGVQGNIRRMSRQPWQSAT